MSDYLVSWKDGKAKQAILDFIDTIATNGSSFVEPSDRIATFDNDGTLWVERPMPPQFDFLFQTWAIEAQKDPSLASEQPYKAIIEKDVTYFQGLVTQDPIVVMPLEQAVAHSWAGTTPEAFDAQVRDFIDNIKHPKFGVGYTKLVYQPMLELLNLLKANDFRVFVCSGGGRDFMRVISEKTWGIYKEDVIGSAAQYVYKDGKIIRTNTMLGGLALGPGKPEHIFARTGRLPLFACGNADVDIEMLEIAKFALLVNHDDEGREYDYIQGAENSLVKAKELGWTIVSMKNDWNTVFQTTNTNLNMENQK
jgi:phosphoglycolate phosphatase-like HAD superfamily hydrolase